MIGLSLVVALGAVITTLLAAWRRYDTTGRLRRLLLVLVFVGSVRRPGLGFVRREQAADEALMGTRYDRALQRGVLALRAGDLGRRYFLGDGVGAVLARRFALLRKLVDGLDRKRLELDHHRLGLFAHRERSDRFFAQQAAGAAGLAF